MEKIVKYGWGTVTFRIKKPGIYAFPPISSDGKSYLYSILTACSEYGISCIRYDTDITVEYVISLLNKFKESTNQILFIDRFDMLFCEDIVNVLNTIKDKYVLLDFKDAHDNNLLTPYTADLYTSEKGFTIDA